MLTTRSMGAQVYGCRMRTETVQNAGGSGLRKKALTLVTHCQRNGRQRVSLLDSSRRQETRSPSAANARALILSYAAATIRASSRTTCRGTSIQKLTSSQPSFAAAIRADFKAALTF